jgi:Spy/CpxP family protein refolding chaperone
VKALLLALAVAVTPAAAQDKKAPPKPQRKMPVAKGHSKPTPEQIRKFNELEKKQGK